MGCQALVAQNCWRSQQCIDMGRDDACPMFAYCEEVCADSFFLGIPVAEQFLYMEQDGMRTVIGEPDAVSRYPELQKFVAVTCEHHPAPATAPAPALVLP